ncbi:MAG: hypothetical protein HY581_05785 [Nitrospirae bacterium]|nr:hypothetical protein [Nitrospirota bacterium]
MPRVVSKRLLVAAWLLVLAGLVLLLIPLTANADYPKARAGWIEQLTGFVVVQQGIAQANGESGKFDTYLDQLALIKELFGTGDRVGTYVVMNRLMDMLEAREGGISAKAADAIWDYCYQVTPPALHDVKRHKEWWDKTVDWDKFFWEE